MSAAVAELLQKEEDRLFAFFLRKTGDPQESLDLLHDLYETVLGGLDSFALVENQVAWLFTAAGNRVVDWYRKKARTNHVSLEQEDGDGESLLDLLMDADLDLEDRMMRDLMLDALYDAVDSLPEKLRQVIAEQALKGRTFRELSEEWDIPQGTLLSRKREALRLLRDALDDFADAWFELEGP